MTTLPKYNPESACVKCGSKDKFVALHSYYDQGIKFEKLYIKCECGYEYSASCLDTETK